MDPTIKDARLAAGLSLRKAAQALGITHPYLVDIEAGSRRLSDEIKAKMDRLYSAAKEDK